MHMGDDMFSVRMFLRCNTGKQLSHYADVVDKVLSSGSDKTLPIIDFESSTGICTFKTFM